MPKAWPLCCARNGTLPTVWIAPGAVRDARELPRTRMALSKMRTALKNRLHATLVKYNRRLSTDSDIFAPKWRAELEQANQGLPVETHYCMQEELALLDQLQAHIKQLEKRILERIRITATMRLLKTLPGVGDILSIVIDSEIGAVDRFPDGEHLASYAGTVPTVQGSGGKFRYGRLPKQCNHYLKWAFAEGANVVSRYRHHPRWRKKHVSRLYTRIRRRKGHSIAVGAVARHLAEAAFWMLKKDEPYQDPALRTVLPKPG